MVDNPGLPGRTVITTVAISVLLVLLMGLLLVLSWGMDVTTNYEQKAIYIYLAPDEFSGLTPSAIKAYICHGALPKRDPAYGIERRGTKGETRYEVYRESKPDADGRSVLQSVIQFSLKDCLQGGN